MSTRMTPRERVLAAMSHTQPDRVPFSWGFGPTAEMTATLERFLAAQGISWQKLRMVVEDIRYIDLRYTGPDLPPGRDIWGIRRRAMKYDGGAYDEIDYYPLAGIEDPSALDTYPWPAPTAYDYARIREGILAADPERRYATKFGGGNPFEIYCWMTGLEEALVNLLVNPELVKRALDYIADFFIARIERVLEQCADQVDILMYADDLGGQQGLLLSRESFREVVMPCHIRMAEVAHRLAPHAKIMHHSDGSVFDLLPDLMECGVDMLEAVQTDAAKMEPERLKASFGDRLAFHGAISVQSLLPHSDTAHVEAECRRIVSILGEHGGYIAAPSHAIQHGTPPENVLAMLHAVLGEEDFQTALECARKYIRRAQPLARERPASTSVKSVIRF